MSGSLFGNVPLVVGLFCGNKGLQNHTPHELKIALACLAAYFAKSIFAKGSVVEI